MLWITKHCGRERERESISFVARRSWQCLGLVEVMLLGAFVR